MEGNPPDGTGPMHVPFGHIVANEKWRGSQLAQGMQGRWAPSLTSPHFLKKFHLLPCFHLMNTELIFLSVF